MLPAIEEVFRRLIKNQSLSFKDFAGIAVGFAAIVDSRTGRVLSTNGKYDDAKSIDLAVWTRDTFGLSLRIENDARMALLGESVQRPAMHMWRNRLCRSRGLRMGAPWDREGLARSVK